MGLMDTSPTPQAPEKPPVKKVDLPIPGGLSGK